MNFTNKSSNRTKPSFPNFKVTDEITTLKIIYCLSFITIIVANGILLWRLAFRMRRSRSNLLFMFLSSSDIFVALISIPIMALDLFKKELSPGCFLPCEVYVVLQYFPYVYSWSLTIVIALDRYFVVTQKRKYEAFITKKRIFIIAVLLLISTFGVSLLYIVVKMSIRSLLKMAIEVLLILVTVFSYINLLQFVRKKSKAARKGQNGAGKKDASSTKLTRIIAYIFFCQVILSLPQWIYLFVLINLKTEKTLTSIMKQRLIYRWLIILRFSNCYTNAFILLYNHYRDYRRLVHAKPAFLDIHCTKNGNNSSSSNSSSALKNRSSTDTLYKWSRFYCQWKRKIKAKKILHFYTKCFAKKRAHTEF